ncbi:MAG: glycosyltransferase [Candidatus Peribacteraceae bacterium]|nr:glycosyltransferase [Candidatus Peribacteraceae bacterium]
MNLAIVSDWLPTVGGAEQVISQFCKIWPKAPLYTTIANNGNLGLLDSKDIRTSNLQKYYKIIGNHRVLLPFMPKAMEKMDLRDYNVILSSSHAVGKGIIPPSSSVHICYCHTPMRYAWEMENEYLKDSCIPHFLQKYIRKELTKIRRWDNTTAKRVDIFIANSTTVQERISRLYNRDSIVIPPPVNSRFLNHPFLEKEDYFLCIGRMVPYKRFDLLIQVANELQIPLRISGCGPEEARLRSQAGPTVEFLGYINDKDLPDLYSKAKAILFPQFEDAGVVPLEAQACGTPVIAYGKGGVLDTVIADKTGIFFEEQNVNSIANALDKFSSMQFSRENIRAHAEQFSEEKFRRKIKNIVEEHMV